MLLAFILVPLIDVAILFRVGQVISFWPTVSLVILTGLGGAALAKHQGLRTLARINAELSAGRMPTSELAEGVLILLAGAVLITPGFLTDAFGLLLLFAPFRRAFKTVLTRYFQARIVVTGIRSNPSSRPDGVGRPVGVECDSTPRSMKHVENEALSPNDSPRSTQRSQRGE
jgi:UPF0716 protein FxsA